MQGSTGTSAQVAYTLPINRTYVKDHICNSVFMNRVTMVVGNTGSGKSSQVPQMLLDDPARILLMDLRENGLAALKRFKVLILDEVHERSVESDLVLACIRQFMAASGTLRLVLMSATAQFQRYLDYFAHIDEVERITIPDLGASSRDVFLKALKMETKVQYLEQVVKLLGDRPQDAALLADHKLRPEDEEPQVSTDMQRLLLDLIAHLHSTDPNLDNVVLVFLPTYNAIAFQYEQLQQSSLPLELYVLHSSIDIDDCLQSMEAPSAHSMRKVILATSIAESSITIPAVHYVIDACRTVQVAWDGETKTLTHRIIWCSKSQADQRKGRTGRTCSGTVHRLVTRGLYNTFQAFETAAMTLLSLREQALVLLCSESRLMNDAAGLLATCMDAPGPMVVQHALDHLVAISAATIVPGPKRTLRYEPTPLGRFLGSLPLSLKEAQMAVNGGRQGLLWEAAVLAAILSTTPFPIKQPFADKAQYEANLACYGPPHPLRSVPLANLAAYEFWQKAFRDVRRWERLLVIASGKPDTPDLLVAGAEERACRGPASSGSGRQAGGESGCSAGPYLPWGKVHSRKETTSLRGLLAARHHDVADATEEGGATGLSSQAPPWPPQPPQQPGPAQPVCRFFQQGRCTFGAQCRNAHSLGGAPTRSPAQADCAFYTSDTGCQNPVCTFRHDPRLLRPFRASPEAMRKEFEPDPTPATPLSELLKPPARADGLADTVLLLGEGDFSFCEALARLMPPRQIVATSLEPKQQLLTQYPSSRTRLRRLNSGSQGVRLLHSIDATQLPMSGSPIAWSRTSRVLWNFPFTGADEDREAHRDLMQHFFGSVAAALALHNPSCQVLLALCNDQFSRWGVEQAAREAFMFVTASHTLDLREFSGYLPQRNTCAEAFPHERAVVYVFQLCLPRLHGRDLPSGKEFHSAAPGVQVLR
ncbi:hypothetical protein WJX72_012211 [[Myrmecia] bisecta]|uniref:Uncharacterized protein n=1 Tax=[Myrmecia] bisecta TaxID=41462 RepID=A0AAW1Q915_9CHLO